MPTNQTTAPKPRGPASEWDRRRYCRRSSAASDAAGTTPPTHDPPLPSFLARPARLDSPTSSGSSAAPSQKFVSPLAALALGGSGGSSGQFGAANAPA
eukprot:CAMPEP_0174861538 /NCGR_PEP_ID=MMETSP1114-20130205/51851_1 /TAXON_ID=312471 /ORGANISM="Neobodo designis, Strain CCAP 1951/1" /LENGTH=97 /DNA_ID=CAMNT_0016096551 /DNA_START=68 /DNA_END=361 /DNA_ORIENTATION=-